MFSFFFFFNDTATTEIYTLSLHDALPISPKQALELVQGMISAGRSPSDLLGLPGQVQAGVGRGATPAQAAAGLARAAGGTPPGRIPDWVPPGQRKPRNPHKP